MGSSSLTRDSTSGVQTTRKVPTLVDIHQRLPFTFIMLFLHRDLSQNHPDTETALRLLWVRCCVSLPQPVSSWETIKGLLASLLTQPLPPLLAEVFCCSIFLSAIASCIFLPYWAHSLSQLRVYIFFLSHSSSCFPFCSVQTGRGTCVPFSYGLRPNLSRWQWVFHCSLKKQWKRSRVPQKIS